MSKIGDLFIKLGLKKQDFDKGIDEAEKQVKGFGVSTGAMATAAAAAWAAVAAAVVKFAKDAVKMTQTWGDRWNETMAGVKGAYSAFVRQLSSGEGFDNLFSNMREAARVARETAKALDELFERRNSANYQTAVIDNQIADLQKLQHDMSKLPEERRKAAEEEKKLTQQKYDLLIDIQKQEASGYRDIFKSQTQLNDEQTDFLVKEFNQNRELINQAKEYREEREKAFNQGGGAPFGSPQFNWTAANAEAEKVDQKYGETVKKIADWTKLYDKGNDELVKKMADAEVAVIELDTQMKHSTDRADRLLGRLNKDDGGSGGTVISQKTKEDISNLEKLEQALEKADQKRRTLMESHQDVVPMKVDVFGIDDDMAALDADFEQFWQTEQEHYDKLIEEKEKWQEAMEDMAQAVAGGFSDACQELMNQLTGLEDFNPGAVVKALLEPLADMAVKEGEILLASGTGIEAIKKSLGTLNGIAAIVAGGALIAIGTAAKAGLSALAKGGSSGATATTYGGGGNAGTATQNIETELTITVEGRISGSDIVLAGQKTINDWSR